MSWIRTKDDSLLNLEHVEQIYLGELEQDETSVFQVIARTGTDAEGDPIGETLFEGTEEACTSFIDKLAMNKLPMVKL